METIIEKVKKIGIVPVISISDASKAVPLAKAIVAGNIPCIEVTLRTKDALECIRLISKEYPDILLGAGTVLSKQQADDAVEAGAKFIVSPGFDVELVAYCIEKGYPVLPGVSNASQIQKAYSMGLSTVKFFPAEVNGGVNALKLYSSVFSTVDYVVTGGITAQNAKDYLALPCVAAIGGSFMASKDLINAGKFDEITQFCKTFVSDVFGFHIPHVGINTENEAESLATANLLSKIFGFPVIGHGGCNFSGTLFEVMKGKGRGKLGHIAIGTRNLARAAAFVESMGVELDWENAKYFPDGKRVLCVFFKNDIAGFAFHLLQDK